MADFFVFLQFLVRSLFTPILKLFNDPHVSVFLGAPLLFILFGFWLARMLYNIFISHSDSLGNSVFAASLKPSNVNQTVTNNTLVVNGSNRAIATYSSAYDRSILNERLIGD